MATATTHLRVMVCRPKGPPPRAAADSQEEVEVQVGQADHLMDLQEEEVHLKDQDKELDHPEVHPAYLSRAVI